MTKKYLFAMVSMLTILSMATPALAFAHDDDGIEKNRSESREEYRREDREDSEDHHSNDRGFFNGIFYKGVVSSVTASGFVMTGKEDDSDSNTTTIVTSSAKIIRIPNLEIALSQIAVGDKVHVTGVKSNNSITASVVYVMSKNLSPSKAKGTVTAVNGNTVTVQTKNNQSVNVQMDSSTQITKDDHQAGSTADVQVGSKVKVFGLWDKVLNILNALKIRIS